MNRQEETWAGPFGDAYTARNRVDWRARVPFWNRILTQTGARSVYEFGCNAGWNLSAIKTAPWHIECIGVDVNAAAVRQANAAGLRAVLLRDERKPPMILPCELAFTAGVLIHIAPEHIDSTVSGLIEMSTDWVLAIEYVSESGREEPIEYRGREDLLWRRNYGALLERHGVRIVDYGDDCPGFDRCTYWLGRRG